MPALMPRRVEACVYFDQVVRTDGVDALLDRLRAERPDLDPTIFHVVLWALARTLDLHPRLNRFLAGGRLWQRDGIWISFTAKTELTEQGTLVEVKHRFDPGQPFAELVADLQAATARTRAGAGTLADRELDLFLHLPPSLRRAVVRVAARANELGVLPRRMTEDDPFFASAFVTNLGSVGLDAAFHHLYEYGNIPLFCAIGRIHEAPVVAGGRVRVARVASVKFSYDERIEDGLYAGHALEDFRAMVEDPVGAGALG